MTISLETFQARHRLVFGRAPTEVADALYRRFPAQRGYAIEEERSVERFEATVVMALTQAFENSAIRVVFFVPRPLELWAIEQFKLIAKSMFGKLKERRDQMSKEALQALIDLFKRVYTQVMIGSEPTREAPLHWCAYGYMEHDPRCPLWIRDGLM